MLTDLNEIRIFLRNLMSKYVPPLKARADTPENFALYGTKEAMQGKQKVDGYYFGSVVTKPKDIRLYFFPIYTHPDQFSLSPELKKCLKGKSCFHFKKLSEPMQKEIANMIGTAFDIYLKDGLV
ncbi:MAG: hypothetical protein H6627_05420 [Calditrichae bacterium]|nr:hypothetical protein [Calditrichota bacterium]MCB9057984.1 hypothetical protein [Calditrichia bacterium]